MTQQKIMITRLELLNYAGNDEQTLLAVLKAKGAPIIGTFLLRLDPAYEWEIVEEPTSNVVTVTITSKENQ